MAFFKSTAIPKTSRETATHMTFRVGGQLYAVPLDMVSEVVALENFSPLHDEDPAVIGEIELRGSALIVVDMRIRLQGLPIIPTSKSCILIVLRTDARSGCLFDAPGGIVNIAADEIVLSGCLVETSGTVTAIPEDERKIPENTSISGENRGFALYKTADETVLLPDRELFYPG